MYRLFGLTFRQLFTGDGGPAPEFENTVKVVLSTFAVFVGFTITEYLRKISIDFGHWSLWAFIALAALLLRYIIGSAVHLNYVYVQKVPVTVDGRRWERPRSQSALLLFKDLCFLVIFGMIAVYITKAANLDDFVFRTLCFVAAGFAWSIVDALVRWALARYWRDFREQPGKFWRLWFALDVLLFVVVLVINYCISDELSRAVVIALVYVLFLFLDFLAIVRAVQFSP
jgi:hypothetical protein